MVVPALLEVAGHAQLLLRHCLFIEEVPVVVDQRVWWFTSLSPVIFISLVIFWDILRLKKLIAVMAIDYVANRRRWICR